MGTNDQGSPDVERDFEAWAAVSARLRKRGRERQNAILRQLGIAEVWPAANEAWTKVLSEDMAADRLQRVNRYGQICAEEIKRRRAASAPAPPSTGLPPATAQPPPSINERTAASTSAASSSPPASSQPSFIESFLSPGSSPRRPAQDQQATAAENIADVREQALAAERAIKWSVEQYAWLCAQLENEAHQRHIVFARYGLGLEMLRDRVTQTWNQRLADDPALHQRWAELVAQYRAELTGNGR